MSTTPPQMPQDWTQPPPQKRGMSSGSKVILILAIVFGGLALVCCGGVIGVVYYFRQAMTEDPAVVREKTAEIAEMSLPDGLKPQMAIDAKVPFTGQPIMTIVVYADDSADTFLFLAAGPAFASQDQAEMQRQINQSLQQKGRRQQGETVIGQSVTKKIQIRGQEVTFMVTVGKGAQSGKPRISVTGAFPSKEGTAMLVLNADAEKYPEEKVIQMLESIR